MRIAQIAPLSEAVPPVAYGGTERVIAALCDGLTDLGHDVTLFAAGTSSTRARLEPVVGAPLRTRMTEAELRDVAPRLHLQMLADVYRRADEFDVIHSHLDIPTLPFTRETEVPSVLTLHGRLDLDLVDTMLPRYPEVPLVSISDHQRTPLLSHRLTWAGTVYNGLDLVDYASAPRGDDPHLCFVGRISPEKGPELAVEVARRTGRRLRVAAKIDPVDIEYYRTVIEPLFTPDVVDFIGEIDEAAKPAFYSGGAAVLFPSDWPEPFGLVMIEAMAAGTPVIALRRGAVPEIMIDGVTGFICDDVDDMVRAVDRIGDIDPDDCRDRARRFNAQTMCTDYERIYASMPTRAVPRTLQA